MELEKSLLDNIRRVLLLDVSGSALELLSYADFSVAYNNNSQEDYMK